MIPLKTPEGQEELSQRKRGLSQRHRTVLLLVDGRRNLQQVLQMALQAGATGTHFDELLELGLVTVPQAGMAASNSAAAPLDAFSHSTISGPITEVDIPLHDEEPPAAPDDAALEAARSLLIQALRAEAPVTSTLTVAKLKRAADREALAELLDEVHARLGKPRKQPEAAAIMRRARELLEAGGDGFAEGPAQPAA